VEEWRRRGVEEFRALGVSSTPLLRHSCSQKRFIRLKNARGFAPGFSEASVRCPMVLADGFPKGVYWSRLEKPRAVNPHQSAANRPFASILLPDRPVVIWINCARLYLASVRPADMEAIRRVPSVRPRRGRWCPTRARGPQRPGEAGRSAAGGGSGFRLKPSLRPPRKP